MIKRALLTIAVTFFFLQFTLIAYSSEICRFTFGIVPSLHPETISETWGPILRELGRRMNCQFSVKTFASFEEFRRHLVNEQLDFALAGSYQVVLVKRSKGYLPLLRDRDPIRVILVVRKDSRFYNIFSLNGTVIGFCDPYAYITTIYIQKKLKEEFGLNFRLKYLKTHDNIFRLVVLGRIDAGCAVDQTFRRQPPEIREKLHILYQSEPFPSPAIIVHPRIPKEIREAFVRHFLAISKEEPYAKLLSRTQIPNPVPADFDRDYKSLERLGLEKSTNSKTN